MNGLVPLPHEYSCRRCNCTNGQISKSGPHVKLSCNDCKIYIKFLSKHDLEKIKEYMEHEKSFG
jgi:transcription elongation factor Elf1